MERPYRATKKAIAKLQKMKSQSTTTPKTVEALERKLHVLLPTPSQRGRLVADLVDIYDVCVSFTACVDELLVMDKVISRKGEDIFYRIDCDIFEHLPYHLKSLKQLMPHIFKNFKQVQGRKRIKTRIKSRTRRGTR